MNTHEIGDTVAVDLDLLSGERRQRRNGTVTEAHGDGQITAEFPQDGLPSMTVSGPAEHFIAVRKATPPLGFIVLIREHGQWTDSWDGQVHTTPDAGNGSLCEARNAGYTAVLTAAVPVGPVPDYAGTESESEGSDA